MILGLRTASYPAKNLAESKAWYARILGIEPYFDEPYYVGFNVGGFELGLIPDGQPGATGTQAYWGVESAATEYERLLSLGAKPHEPVQDVGGGIKVGSVLDPSGNVFSIIENPHFRTDQVK